MLIVEDGTGLVDANSYGSIATVNAYMAGSTDDTTWLDASTDRQEFVAQQVTQYLDGTFIWKGEVHYSTQALGFPRIDVYDNEGRYIDADSLPPALVRAFCFLCGKGIALDLQPERVGAPIKSKSVGTLSIVYGDQGQTTVRQWPEVRTMLAGLYVGGPGGLSGTLVRWS